MPRAIRKCRWCEIDVTPNAQGLWRTIETADGKCLMSPNLRHKPNNRIGKTGKIQGT
jgi:hypothetical protein